MKAAGSDWWLPIRYSWSVALLVFIAADIVAFFA
jgi:hypothetical protein